MTIVARTAFLQPEMPGRDIHDIFRGKIADMRQITFADGSTISDTCEYGLATAFVEWSRMGEGEIDRSRQQLVDLDIGRVRDVRVPETPDAYREVVELRT